MGRPGYLSLYADERTQQIFDEFVKIKGVSKSTALPEGSVKRMPEQEIWKESGCIRNCFRIE